MASKDKDDPGRPAVEQGAGKPFMFFTGQINTKQLRAECPNVTIVARPFQRWTILAAIADMLGGAERAF